MIIVYIKSNSFVKNADLKGNIVDFVFESFTNKEGIVEVKDLYLEKGFKKVELDNKYFDCCFEDFNDDLTFNVEKYNDRKQKEIIIPRIAELKHLLASQDYQTIKYMQGELTEEKFNEVKKQCKEWRDEINALEASL